MPGCQKDAEINALRVLLVACWLTILGDESEGKKSAPCRKSNAKAFNDS